GHLGDRQRPPVRGRTRARTRAGPGRPPCLMREGSRPSPGPPPRPRPGARRGRPPAAGAAAAAGPGGSMLSRIAESLFWIGRYIERAEDTARILDVYIHHLLEAPVTSETELCASLLGIMGVSGPVEGEV